MFDSDNSQLTKLKKLLKQKTLIVGIGNPLKGDDGAGPELIRKLEEKKLPAGKYRLLDVGEAPENYLHNIIKEKPDTLMLVDAVDMKISPGSVKILKYDDILDNSLSTHNASLKLTMDYIKSEINTDIFIVGIQPAGVGFGDSISAEVNEAIKKICRIIGIKGTCT